MPFIDHYTPFIHHFVLLQIATGKIGIYFPTNNMSIYLFKDDNDLKDKLVKDILPVSKDQEKSSKELNKNCHIGAIVRL